MYALTIVLPKYDVTGRLTSSSGTHWVWEVVHMLTSGKAEYESRSKEHLMLEFIEAERFDNMPSPRIINSHLSLRYLLLRILIMFIYFGIVVFICSLFSGYFSCYIFGA